MDRTRARGLVPRRGGRRSPIFAAALSASLVLPFATSAQQAVVPLKPTATEVASTESMGMSSARLELITKAFNKEIADKNLPGAVVMVARKGRVVYSKEFGVRDPGSTDPMRTDTIFHIYSMTKPMVSVAALLLVEDGVLQLVDPVSKWLPAFKDVKVASAGARLLRSGR